MFPDDPRIIVPPKYGRLGSTPVWTQHKCDLIVKYLNLFVMVTHNGTYIDGFAGPQYAEHQNAWSSKRALQLPTPRLSKFFLCEKKLKSYKKLDAMVKTMPKVKGRTVRTYRGDFNFKVDQMLSEAKISPKRAVFCLLDQHTFECKWTTVERLARYKPGGYKIELFYFLCSGWIERAMSGVTKDKAGLRAWWGNDLATIKKTRNDIRRYFLERIEKDLGYKFVFAYPIYNRDSALMYDMIHASDHPEAPRLMGRAYRFALRKTAKQAVQTSFDGMDQEANS